MKIIKIITVFVFSVLIFSNANAVCDFEFNIGDDESSVVEKYGITLDEIKPKQSIFIMIASDLCPGNSLEGVVVEYMFLDKKLASINLKALNNETNSVSNKLGLYKYVENTYGVFNFSGDNPLAWNNFHSWNDHSKTFYYKRMLNLYS